MNTTNQFEKLFTKLDQIQKLPDDFKDELAKRLLFKEFSKRDLILREGQKNQYIYFINHGILRAYYEKDDKEITSWFMAEGDFIISVYSFFTSEPSFETIEALKPTALVYLHFNDLLDLYNKSLEFNVVGRKITEYYYMKSEERLISWRQQKASDRYESFLQQHAELANEIPVSHLASFLGMTVETLSRIRSMR